MKKIFKFLLISSCSLILLWIYQVVQNQEETIIVESHEGYKEEREVEDLIEPFTIEYERNYSYSLYEPKEGSYIGAYVLANKYIDYSIKELDDLTEKQHQLSMTYINAGKHINKDWMYECMAYKKIPYIYLMPPENLLSIETTIRNLADYNMPFFVVLSPIQQEGDISSEAYTDNFRNISSKVKDIAPMCAIVWAVDDDYVTNSLSFYPGDDYVDWIGLNMRLDDLEKDYMGSINDFYDLYNEKKPLIINELGVANYDNEKHKYEIDKSTKIIKEIYSSLAYYTRIKGINYLNIHITDPEVMKSVYAITEDKRLLNTYKTSISSDHFISKFYRNPLVGTEVFKYESDLLYYNKNYYISQCHLLEALNSSDLARITKIKYKENVYYSLKDIDTLTHYSIILDRENKKIGIK